MKSGPLAGRPWLLALLASAAFHSPALLRPGSAYVPLDHYGLAQPWLGEKPPPQLANPILFDQAFDVLPWHEFLRRSVADGFLPLWNPHQALGEPFAGNPQSRLFDPANWLVAAVNGATGSLYGWALSAWLRAAISFFFVAKLVRLLGGDPLGALAGGAVYAFGGFSVVYLNHPHGHVSPWIPMAAYAAALLRREPSRKRLAGLAAGVALSILAGQPETALVGLGVVGVVFLLSGGAGKPPVGRFALGAGIGAMLAAPVLAPFLEYLLNGAGEALRAGENRTLLASDRPWAALPWSAAGALLLLVARLRSRARAGRWASGLPLVSVGLLCLLHLAPHASGGESLATLLWPASSPPEGWGGAVAPESLRLRYGCSHFVGLGASLVTLGAFAQAVLDRRREPFAWLWLLATADFLREPLSRLALHGWWPAILQGSHVSGLGSVLASALVVGRGLRLDGVEGRPQTLRRIAAGGAVSALCAIAVWIEDRTGPLRIPRRPPEEAASGEIAAILGYPPAGATIHRRLVASGYVASKGPLEEVSLELLSERGERFARSCDSWPERPESSAQVRSYAWFVRGWDTARLPRGTYGLALLGRDAAGNDFTSRPLGSIDLAPFRSLSGGRLALILASAAAAFALGFVGRRRAAFLDWLLALGVAADPIATGFGFNAPHPDRLREIVEDAFLAEVRSALGHDRLLPDLDVFPPETATLARVRETRSYDGIHPASSWSLLREVSEGRDPASPSWGPVGLAHRKLPLLGLRGLLGVGEAEPPPPWRLAGSRGPVRFNVRDGPGGRAFLAEDTGLDNPSPAPEIGTVEFEVDEPNRVVLRTEAARPALLVLADTFFPGWRARLDGVPVEILPVSGAVRGVRVPAGPHRVEFAYAPLSLSIGLGLAAAALAGLALLARIPERRGTGYERYPQA